MFFLIQLEEVGVEVCDEVYESYTRLLSQQTDEAPSADMWFKTYLLVGRTLNLA